MIKAKKTLKIFWSLGQTEKNLHESISSVLTSSMHWLCDLHMKDNIKSKLVELRITNENRHVIFDDIFGKIVINVKEEGLWRAWEERDKPPGSPWKSTIF